MPSSEQQTAHLLTAPGTDQLEVRAHRVIDPNLLRALSPAEIKPETDATISDIYGRLIDRTATAWDTWYAHDVLGDDPDIGRVTVSTGWMKFLEKFVAMGDDEQIHLVTQPDEICSSCVFRQHCSADQGDLEAIFRFVTLANAVAREAGRRSVNGYHFVVSQGKVERLVTSKGVVSEVIARQKAWRPYYTPRTDVGCNPSKQP